MPAASVGDLRQVDIICFDAMPGTFFESWPVRAPPVESQPPCTPIECVSAQYDGNKINLTCISSRSQETTTEKNT